MSGPASPALGVWEVTLHRDHLHTQYEVAAYTEGEAATLAREAAETDCGPGPWCVAFVEWMREEGGAP